MAITTGILTGGSNSHQTTSEEANAVATDFVSEGVTGLITNTSGVAPATGSFAVNAQGSPNMTVAVSTGVAYVTATPSSQGSQAVRVKNSASANVTISANASGSTKYDWVYLSVSAANAANPNTAADNVTTLVTSRSSNATADDGSPPTYGLVLAVVTVANAASSITNGNISDRRVVANVAAASTSFPSTFTNFVESGCIWTADAAASTRNASMTSGYVWLAGQRLVVASVSARSFTASKDVYIDLSNNGDGTALITYTDNTTNAAAPALTAGSLRLGIVVVGATSIAAAASINQGQQDRLLPIASSRPYAVTDSLGNLICPRDPASRILGASQTTSSLSTASTTVQASAILICPVIIPAGRKVKLSYSADNAFSSSLTGYAEVSLWEGVAGSGTQLKAFTNGGVTAAGQAPSSGFVVTTPSATSKTYSLGYRAVSAGTATVTAGANDPIQFTVELL